MVNSWGESTWADHCNRSTKSIDLRQCLIRGGWNSLDKVAHYPQVQQTNKNEILHSSPKVMAVFLFLIFEKILIGGMFSILETIKTDRSILILQNKNWCQMINPMCTTFQMWLNCILQNQVCFERLISLSKTPYIFVKISKPRNWDPYSISAMSHGNRTSSYETAAHKLRPSVAFDWQYTPRQKLWPFPQT